MPKNLKNQQGVIHFLPLLFAAMGLITFLLITSTADFKNKLFSSLFPKPPSKAAFSTTIPNSYAAQTIDPRFATAGPAAPALGDLYYYIWDNMSDPTPPDQSVPAPNHKFFWVVGKLDNRHDGLSCYPNCDLAALTNIYTSEEPKIRTLLSRDINKGGVWIVGNEANSTPKIDPGLYAWQFKKYKDLIKSLDATAQVGHSGLVGFSNYSLGNYDPIPYLNAVLAALPSTADWPDLYNIHLYPDQALPQYDINNVNQARDFRSNLISKGEGSKSIWVTEIGFGSGSVPSKMPNRVIDYMDTVIGGLKNDNSVQRWFWFIGSAEPGIMDTALTNNGQLTLLGSHYQQLGGITQPLPTTGLVFITKFVYDGNLGGLSGADQKCMMAAANANLTGTFKAWLSDSQTAASSGFSQSTLPYKLLNGTTIANNWTDLTDGQLLAPINIDETGSTVAAGRNVWTNTTPSGNTDSSSNNCKNFASGNSADKSSIGKNDQVKSGWTTGNNQPCDQHASIYCFEQ